MASFQIDIKSKEMFQSELLEVPDMLQVLEVYQAWSGPCKPLREMCKRLYFDYADKGLKFFTVEAGTLERTVQFKDICKPVFLFYKNGQELKEFNISGVDYPQLVANVIQILTHDS